tara:strand:- start:1501 stop:1755 length:255 start_codon:yes stop_codon:yes gene_type:complete
MPSSKTKVVKKESEHISSDLKSPVERIEYLHKYLKTNDKTLSENEKAIIEIMINEIKNKVKEKVEVENGNGKHYMVCNSSSLKL